jgi:hypothetical protein
MPTDPSPRPRPSISNFVALPSDPAVALSPDELRALFPQPAAWRDIISFCLQSSANGKEEVTCEQNS